jgi:hypothetical protein
MKVAITGHTSGLGKSLNSLFQNSIGMSRSNGFNILHTDKIIEHSKNCDVFINNAYDGYGQLELLYDLYDEWKDDSSKTIVTIGSLASNAAEWRLKPCKYSTVKKALDIATYQLVNSHHRKCKLMIFKPGYLGNNHIPYDYAAKKLYNAILENDYETIEITLRP